MIILAGYISKIMTMADGSVRVFFDAQELKPEVMANVYGNRMKPGTVAFIPAENISEEDQQVLDEITKRTTGTGSHSQLYRNAIYRYWKGLKEAKPFDQFYAEWMGTMIRRVEDAINKETHGI